MACHHTVLAQILKLVPRYEFEKEARLHHKGRKLRKMTRWSQGVVLAMGPLSTTSSRVRTISASLRSAGPISVGSS